ncbi:MAG TPA: GNAT family N-acetyltransferase [Steroidobacteraceae bacterium]|nr:GNAT family N-acetyltransferase [Steroidobacteraceae bacterium]
MSSSIRVCDAVGSDLEFLARGNEAMALETEHRTLDAGTVRRGVATALHDDAHGRYFVAEDESGTAVGQLMVTYEWSDWRNGQFWWIQSVYVVPAARRHGVFKAMYRHVEGLARATAGVCGLRLYVESNNATAQRTYTRCGMHDAHYRVMEVELTGAHLAPLPKEN